MHSLALSQEGEGRGERGRGGEGGDGAMQMRAHTNGEDVAFTLTTQAYHINKPSIPKGENMKAEF